jgi:hypothetical protein
MDVSMSPKILSAVRPKSPPPSLPLPCPRNTAALSCCCPRTLATRPPCSAPTSAAPAPTFAAFVDDGRAYEQRVHFGTRGGWGAARTVQTLVSEVRPLLCVANDIEAESMCAAYLCKSCVATTPLPLTHVQIQVSVYGVIQTSNSCSKYAYLLFLSLLFFLIFGAFLVKFSICDLVDI